MHIHNSLAEGVQDVWWDEVAKGDNNAKIKGRGDAVSGSWELKNDEIK